MKRCSVCLIEKTLDAFAPNGTRNGKPLWRSGCKDCSKNKAAQWRDKNRGRYRENAARSRVNVRVRRAPERQLRKEAKRAERLSVPTHTCRHCGETKPREAFTKAPSCVDGYSFSCKVCATALKQAILRADPAKAERVRLQMKKRLENPENRAKQRKAGKASYYKNHEVNRAKKTAISTLPENKEKGRVRARKAYARDPAKYQAKYKDYVTKNPGSIVVRSNRRRANLAAVKNDLTAEQWRAIKAAYGGCCAYCSIYCDTRGRMHMDHVIPVSKGGGNTAGNVVPACNVCNVRKHDKMPGQWYGQLIATQMGRLEGAS